MQVKQLMLQTLRAEIDARKAQWEKDLALLEEHYTKLESTDEEVVSTSATDNQKQSVWYLAFNTMFDRETGLFRDSAIVDQNGVLHKVETEKLKEVPTENTEAPAEQQ